MNERIKELAEQAGYKADMFGVGHWDMPECKKFAELIVRECAGACLHDDWEDPRWGRFYANKIKEHFGVK
jgi:hypothetical protein